MVETAEWLRHEAAILRRQNGVLRSVLDNISEGILLVSDSGEVLASNAAGVSLSSDWASSAAVDQGIVHYSDGRWIERVETQVPGLGQLYVLRDVTEERKIDKQRLRLEKIIESMKQGFAVIALDDETVMATNASFDVMHGHPVGGLKGAPLASLYFGSAEESQSTASAVREAAERDGFWEGETRSVKKDGTVFVARARVNLHIEESRRILSLIQMDVSAQKRKEEEGEKIRNKLLHTQKLESLGVLAGGVAHDFNNLLTGILGNASLAQELLPESSPVQPNLRDVVQASERAADLTRQLLAYSGKGRFVVEPINVSDLATENTKLLRLSIPRTVSLEVHAAPNLPLVEVDAGQIQQIVMNLVINAAEAIGDKTGVVQVNTGVQTLEPIDVKTTFAADGIRPGRYVFIEIQDNGCGMDEETRAQIFDPFFTTKFTGRGLGLAAAIGIVRGHRGAIKVYSDVGAGSTFRVLLPVWEGDQPVAVPPARQQNLSGSGTVLVVDDEELVRRTTQNTLRHFGYDVVLAENGLEALNIFAKMGTSVSLILLDMTMPVMSGEETLREIRKIRPEVRVILTSGFNESEAIRRFAGQGLAGFIQKPFTSSKLAEKVKSVVSGL